ncbi:MAG: alcohol dehydrogenase catalytic domain-containing protein [Kineosporiaceae bacterium]|nr:alcohol dehydrogenase catalytic domain-containing protein [Aeromicrobium sp.]
MKAIVVEQDVKGSVLAMTDIPVPEPGPSQVKIRVRTASVNRADLAQRAHSDGGPVVVGLDAAGDVVEVGREVIGIRVGDRVMAIANGGLSEEVVVDAALAVPIPETWSYAGAPLPSSGL